MLAQIYNQIDTAIKWVDDRIWGLPLIILILTTGIYLTVRLGGLQIRHLPKALRFMVKNEEEGHGEVTSFGALCTALSATIGTGNITGVATAIAAGGPGALFWMVVAAFFGMATKYAEGLLAIKYRTIDKEGHVLGGPFYYIENGMVAGNHDIDTIFIDSVLKQADISLNNISAFMTSLSKISAENTLDFFISVGAEKESIPDIDSDNYNVLN